MKENSRRSTSSGNKQAQEEYNRKMKASKEASLPRPTNLLVDHLYNKTVEWGGKYGLEPRNSKKKRSKYPKKVQEINKLLQDNKFGCYTEYVRKVVSDILIMADIIKDPLPVVVEKTKKKMEYELGTVLVKIDQDSGPMLVIPGEEGKTRGCSISLAKKSKAGRKKKVLVVNYELTSSSNVRIAEKEEIEYMIETLKEGTLLGDIPGGSSIMLWLLSLITLTEEE